MSKECEYNKDQSCLSVIIIFAFALLIGLAIVNKVNHDKVMAKLEVIEKAISE